MWKVPSLTSFLIFFIFLVIRPGKFNTIEGSYECVRFFNGVYNWNIFLPIFYVLLLFSLLELWRIRNSLKENIFTVILIAPVILFKLYFLINLLANAFIWI